MDKEIKAQWVSLRLTETEMAKLSALMAMENYKSRSKYIRHVLFDTRVRRRNFRRTEANLTKQLELLRMEIKRIGVNYNQVVKTMNTLANIRDKRGHAVITAHSVDGNLTDLKSMMMSVLDKMDSIEKEIEAMDNNNSSLTF